MVQEMAEGALTVTSDGLILFSNEQFAAMLRSPLEQVIGRFRAYEGLRLPGRCPRALGAH